MATLAATFGGAKLAMGGEKKESTTTPPINAKSSDEEKYIKYESPETAVSAVFAHLEGRIYTNGRPGTSLPTSRLRRRRPRPLLTKWRIKVRGGKTRSMNGADEMYIYPVFVNALVAHTSLVVCDVLWK